MHYFLVRTGLSYFAVLSWISDFQQPFRKLKSWSIWCATIGPIVSLMPSAMLSVLSCASTALAFSAVPAGLAPPAVSSRSAVHMVTATPTDLKGSGDKASFDTTIDSVPKCPLTRWDADGVDLAALQSPARTVPLEVRFDAASGISEWESMVQQREEILAQLEAGGAIWFRGFELMKTKEGFVSFYEALQLSPCQDPLASVGARAVVSAKGAMYEAVNKPSRAKFFVGMHNESTYKRTNRVGAFVCFKQAAKGGEFLLADGRAVLADMDKEVLGRLYSKGVRFSNAELPMFDFLRSVPDPAREVLQPALKKLADAAVAVKIDMELELKWAESEKDGLRLQAFSPAQSPINRHPTTGEPSWFCNVHSHSRYLRDTRDNAVEVVETSGASKFNVTDMFYGDGTPIPVEDLEHIDEVTRKNLVSVLMEPGDVVMVDNYQMAHGRDVFEGERLHAVTWFE